MNADPQVMRFFPAPYSASESDSATSRASHRRWRRTASAFVAAERQAERRFRRHDRHNPHGAGYRRTPARQAGDRDRLAPATPGSGVRGWRPKVRAPVSNDAWTRLGLDEIIAYTAARNLPSQRVMEKIGMHRDPVDDFVHPRIAAGHPLRPQVLYRIRRR